MLETYLRNPSWHIPIKRGFIRYLAHIEMHLCSAKKHVAHRGPMPNTVIGSVLRCAPILALDDP